MKNKKIIIVLLPILVILIGSSLVLFTRGNTSELELIKLKESSNDIVQFLEEIDNDSAEDLDRYIAYALEYSFVINNKDTLNVKDIKKIIEDRFNISLNEEKLNLVGVTPYLLDKYISHNYELKEYSKYKKYTQREIAKISVTKYELKDIKKSGKKYILTYDKYLVEDPYKVLNYYINNTEKAEEMTEMGDLSSYIYGKGTVLGIKNVITKDNIESVGKIDKEVTITYIVKNGKLLVDSIK